MSLPPQSIELFSGAQHRLAPLPQPERCPWCRVRWDPRGPRALSVVLNPPPPPPGLSWGSGAAVGQAAARGSFGAVLGRTGPCPMRYTGVGSVGRACSLESIGDVVSLVLRGDFVEPARKEKPEDSNTGVAQGYAYETGLFCLIKYRVSDWRLTLALKH